MHRRQNQPVGLLEAPRQQRDRNDLPIPFHTGTGQKRSRQVELNKDKAQALKGMAIILNMVTPSLDHNKSYQSPLDSFVLLGGLGWHFYFISLRREGGSIMNAKFLFIGCALTVLGSQALAKRGGDRRARPETITCGLLFDGATQLEAVQSVLVENAQAVLRGESQGISYVFSVRGKTAVARISDGSQVVNAQGAIEMLRHGGEVRAAATESMRLFRRGEDDANDGSPEREAGFQVSIADAQAPTRPKVSLKCESVNQTQPSQGALQ